MTKNSIRNPEVASASAFPNCRISRRVLLEASALATVGASLFNASGNPAFAARGTGSSTLDTFTLAQDIDPETLNPTKVARTQSRNVYATMFDALIHRDPELVLQPALAESWGWVTDTSLELKLRSGVKFHDGSDFTGDDVKYTIEQAMLPESAHAGNLERISSIEVPDPLSVTITTSEADPLLIGRITDIIYIIPAAYHQEVGDEGFEQNPVGTGPFVFSEWVKGDHVTVTANPDYWDGPPAIQTVVIRSIPEATTRVSTVQSGGADLGIYVPVALVPPLQEDSSVELLIGSSPDAIYLGMAVTNEILADQRVRQAINHAIDVSAIATRLGGEDAVVIGGYILPGMIGYDPALEPYPYDPELARELLAEAGYADGFEVVFDVPDGRVPSPNDTAAIVASYLLEVGITANIQLHAFDEFADYLYQRNGKALTGLWYFHGKSSTLDPDDLVGASFHTGGRWNWGGVNNPDLDVMLDQAYAETDEEQRAALYTEIDQVIKEQAYYVPLYQLVAYYVVNPSDEWNWEPRPDELVFIADDVTVT